MRRDDASNIHMLGGDVQSGLQAETWGYDVMILRHTVPNPVFYDTRSFNKLVHAMISEAKNTKKHLMCSGWTHLVLTSHQPSSLWNINIMIDVRDLHHPRFVLNLTSSPRPKCHHGTFYAIY